MFNICKLARLCQINNHPKTVIPALGLILSSGFAQAAEPIKIVVPVRPLAFIADAVGGEHIHTTTMVSSGQTPHDLMLTPSLLRAVEQSDIVLSLPGTETDGAVFRLQQRAAKAHKLADIQQLDAFVFFPLREGDEPHDPATEDAHKDAHADEHNEQHEDGHNDEHDKEHADTHGDEDHDESHNESHDQHAAEHSDEEVHHHDEHAIDPHFWLSPLNAEHLANYLAQEFAHLRPENSEYFLRNAQTLINEIDDLSALRNTATADNNAAPMIVLHDAFQYLERYLQLPTPHIVLLHNQQRASISQLRKLRKDLAKQPSSCLILEPQYQYIKLPQLQQQALPSVAVDPLATDEKLTNYVEFITQISKQLLSCSAE